VGAHTLWLPWWPEARLASCSAMHMTSAPIHIGRFRYRQLRGLPISVDCPFPLILRRALCVHVGMVFTVQQRYGPVPGPLQLHATCRRSSSSSSRASSTYVRFVYMYAAVQRSTAL
jgi:hypothetical protein